MNAPGEVRPPSLRLRQGLVLMAGAVVFALVVGPAPDRFYLTPLGLGLVYLLAATIGGRRGGYWATALVLAGWGATVVWAHEGRPDLDVSGMYLLGAGAGATLGVVLARRGFTIDALGLAVTVLVGGLLLALSAQWPDVIEEARVYALLVGLVGAANVLTGALLSGGDRASGAGRA